jgi:crotonobetainyl-CoA:carnitine CoA-transferase CaiB-like acyl-CoA transferase
LNPLDNYRVIDLADEKGMLCSKLLSDMGAEVIRIEKPGQKIPRIYANAGKRNITLDIESKKGQYLFKRIINNSDILVESFSPGYLPSMDLDYPELEKTNPRLIMASITNFGQTGPYRDFKSSDLVSAALGGQLSVCGDPDKPPLKPYGPQAFNTASLFAANGILLALWQRHTSGKGQYLDISVHESVASTLDHVLVRYFYEREVASRQGSLYWNNAFRIFRCKDGSILLSLSHQWDTLVELLASEGMAEDLLDEKWKDAARRNKEIGHIIEILGKWTLTHEVDELVELGQLMHFPWAKVASIPEVVNNPQLNDRGFFIEAIDPDSGKTFKFPGAPFKMSQSPLKINPTVPFAGEYNHDFYRHQLGLTEAEIAILIREKVV